MNKLRITYVWVILILALFNIFCLDSQAEEVFPVQIQTIIGECANCDETEMMAVANVIRNRMEVRNQSVSEVCLAPYQFSCHNDQKWLRRHIQANKSVSDKAWSAWQASGTEDITNGADHYFANYINKPSWASKMTHVATYGVHEFYRS